MGEVRIRGDTSMNNLHVNKFQRKIDGADVGDALYAVDLIVYSIDVALHLACM